SASDIAVPNGCCSARLAGMNLLSTEIASTMRKALTTRRRRAGSIPSHSREPAPSVNQIGRLFWYALVIWFSPLQDSTPATLRFHGEDFVTSFTAATMPA